MDATVGRYRRCECYVRGASRFKLTVLAELLILGS